MKTKIVTFLLMLSISFSALTRETRSEVKLNAFTSDFCSQWPEGEFLKSSWADCCFVHDLQYWFGGSEDERKAADQDLKQCVKLSGAELNSFVMYIGVRIGGMPGPASYAWGYGWSSWRGYQSVTLEEMLQGKVLLEEAASEYSGSQRDLINKFIDEVLNVKISNQLSLE